MHTLSKDDLKILSIITITASSLSILGSCFIIFIYFYLTYKEKCQNKNDDQSNDQKQKLKMGFGQNLIFFLSISDLLYSIATFLNANKSEITEIDSKCVAQGFLITFSETNSITWISMISLSIYLGTYGKDITKIKFIYFYFFLYSWGLSLILSVGPLFTSSYGPAGLHCWIKTLDKTDDAAWAWALTIYIVNWVNIIFNVFAIIKTIRYFKVRAFEVKEDNNKEANFLRNYIIVLKFFPFIQTLCWLFPTINRLYIFISNKQSLVLFSFQYFFSSIQGLLDSMVYSYYYRAFIPCWGCMFSSKSGESTKEVPVLNEGKMQKFERQVTEVKDKENSIEMQNSSIAKGEGEVEDEIVKEIEIESDRENDGKKDNDVVEIKESV